MKQEPNKKECEQLKYPNIPKQEPTSEDWKKEHREWLYSNVIFGDKQIDQEIQFISDLLIKEKTKWENRNKVFFRKEQVVEQNAIQEERKRLIEWIDNSEMDGFEINAVLTHLKSL